MSDQDDIKNFARHSNIFRNGAGVPVVGLDIDGTLGDYHGHFLRFAEGWLGRSMPDASEINPGLRLSDFMGVPHEVYRTIKLAYRQGGMKRTMPVYDGAADLTQDLRKAGVEIWICTTRPYNRLDNIDPDTQEWLERHQIAYNHILFDDPAPAAVHGFPTYGKYGELARQVSTDRIVAVADDLVEQLKLARAHNIMNCYLRAQPYNGKGVDSFNMKRVASIGSLQYHLMMDLAQWRVREGTAA